MANDLSVFQATWMNHSQVDIKMGMMCHLIDTDLLGDVRVAPKDEDVLETWLENFASCGQ